MPIPAGAYDPVKAKVYRQITEYINNEPIQTVQLFCERHIRFPQMARTGVEYPVQHLTHSVGQILIRVRRDSKTVLIDPSMEFHHRGTVYGIIIPNPIPSLERDEIEFLLQYRAKSLLINA